MALLFVKGVSEGREMFALPDSAPSAIRVASLAEVPSAKYMSSVPCLLWRGATDCLCARDLGADL